jgi:death-on-curing protein
VASGTKAYLESALAAAQNRHGYEGADVVSCAAAFAYHLTQAHAFIDGNKRVAAAVTETFIRDKWRPFRNDE